MKWLSRLKMYNGKLQEGMPNVGSVTPDICYDYFSRQMPRIITILEKAERGGMTVELGLNPSMALHNVCPICFAKEGHGRVPDRERAEIVVIDGPVDVKDLCPFHEDWEPTIMRIPSEIS